MINNLLSERALCCGCGTCAVVCPTKAISMVPKELGCLYPEIDEERCIGCGLCEKNCAYQNRNSEDTDPIRAYAAAAKDDETLLNSASGGMFAAIAKRVLSVGGVVFGCSMEMENDKLQPMHICVERPEDIPKLQGSKYVQSKLMDALLQVKQKLKEGKAVLFSGTPCQIDALKHFLRNEDTTNLYTMDLICHGVPSAQLFQDYLAQLEKEDTVCEFRFRDKTFGWGLNACYTVIKRNGEYKKKLLPPGISSYYTFFLESEIYRESCYSCRYAKKSRVGDITIGDFWGIETEHPEYLVENCGMLNVNRGISAVLVSTAKGEKLLESMGKDILLQPSTLPSVVRHNRQLEKPSSHSDVRRKLEGRYAVSGYLGIERLYRIKLGIRYYARRAKWMIQEICAGSYEEMQSK